MIFCCCCTQISLEPPRSLKSNLQQLLSSTGASVVNRETFDGGDGAWRQLVFGLSMFHAAVNARKKYGAVGWRVPYDFSSADLQVSTVPSVDLHIIQVNPSSIYPASKTCNSELVYTGCWKECSIPLSTAGNPPTVTVCSYLGQLSTLGSSPPHCWGDLLWREDHRHTRPPSPESTTEEVLQSRSTTGRPPLQ